MGLPILHSPERGLLEKEQHQQLQHPANDKEDPVVTPNHVASTNFVTSRARVISGEGMLLEAVPDGLRRASSHPGTVLP
ncbi:MAG: hypothetical protein Phog2KO_51050 [Phototrophicaceae bacterium]